MEDYRSNGILTHTRLVRKRTLNHLWPVWLNGWVFVYEMSGCGFESRCCHLNFRYGACFEQGVPWHSSKTIECRFTLKLVCDMIVIYSQRSSQLVLKMWCIASWCVWKKNNRNTSLKNYGLCLSHYLSAQVLRWGARLGMTRLSTTNVELELISESDMYLFFEKVWGRVFYISKRYGKANTKS